MDNNKVSKIWVRMSSTNIHLLQFKIQSHLQKRGLSMPVHLNSYHIIESTRNPIPPRVMASSALELQLGMLGFLPTTHGNKRNQNAFTIFDTELTNYSDFDRGKKKNNLNTPNLSLLPG